MWTLSLGLHLPFQLRDVVDAVSIRLPRYELASLPLTHDPAGVLARDAGHGGKVALADLVRQNDPSIPRILAEQCGEVEENARQAALRLQEARGGERVPASSAAAQVNSPSNA